MKQILRVLHPSFLLRTLPLLALLSVGLPACRSDGEAVCDLKCECEGCSDAKFNDCANEDGSKADSADRNGCLGYYDDLKACEYDTGFCKSGANFETSCKNEKERFDNCMK